MNLDIEMSLGQIIETIFLSVQFTNGEPEEDTADPSDDAHGTVIPNEVRVEREGGERFANGGRDGAGE